MPLMKRRKNGMSKKKITTRISIICDTILSELCGDDNPTRVQRLWMAVVKRAILDLYDPEVEDYDRRTANAYFITDPCHLRVLNIDEEYFRAKMKREGFELPERKIELYDVSNIKYEKTGVN